MSVRIRSKLLKHFVLCVIILQLTSNVPITTSKFDMHPRDPIPPPYTENPEPQSETFVSKTSHALTTITDVTSTRVLSTAITVSQTTINSMSSTSTEGLNVCKPSNDNDVTWPRTIENECSVSSPLCINDQMEVSQRCCESYGWADEPECYQTQSSTITNPCPSDLTYISQYNLCVVVTEPSSYPPVCPYEEIVNFADYKAVKGTLTDDPVWMPVIRDVGRYGFGQLLWMEPSTKYKMSYTSCSGSCEHFYYSGSIVDKNCLIYSNSTYVEAVSCNNQYPAICAYKPINTRVFSHCSQSAKNVNFCKQSDYSSKSKCFCAFSITSDVQVEKVEFLLPYQNLVYPTLSADECYIGLGKDGDRYVWTTSNTPINYTFWSTEAEFNENNIYGAITTKGWVLNSDETEANTCVLYQTEPPVSSGSLTLTYNESTNEFTVTIVNAFNWLYDEDTSSPLMYCFTDAAPTTVIYRITDTDYSSPITQGDDVLYPFKPLSIVESGPGNYWCEGFLYPDIHIKRSNEVLYRPEAYVGEYVAILKYKYDEDNHPLVKDNISFLQTLLKNDISSNISFFPRLFKIYKVDETNQELTINFHFSSTKSKGTYEEYIDLLAVLKGLDEFTLEGFLSVDFCVGTYTNSSSQNIYWPITPVNSVANPEGGLCLSERRTFVKRYCYGNFTDGANWSEPNTPCTFYECSTITVNLTTMISSNFSSVLVQQLVQLSERHSEFVSLDVYLVSVILETFLNKIDLKSLTIIVSNIMKIPGHILVESQINLLATDRILYYVDRIAEISDEEGIFTEDNFAIVVVQLNDTNTGLHGIRVSQCTGSINCTISILTSDDLTQNGGSNIELLEDLSVFKAGFVLSETLLTQIFNKYDTNSTYVPRIVTTIYTNSTLFNEKGKTIDSSVIFGVSLPDFSEEFLGSISFIFYATDDDNIDDYNCSYWQYNVLSNASGFWEYDNEQNQIQNIIACEFWHLTHISIVNDTNNVETNITVRLMDIENSQLNMQLKLKRTNSLTLQYVEFTAIDINLVAEILSQTNNVSKEELYYFTSILNNIMNVPISVLIESRDQYQSIDKLLQVYGRLFFNFFNESYYFHQDNLISLVLTDDTTFGMILENCDSVCTTSFVAADDNMTEIYQNTRNFELGVVLKPHEEHSTTSNDLSCNTAITVFLSDVLFQSSMNYQSIGKTVGINFLNQTGNSSFRDIYLYYGLKSYGIDPQNEYYDCGIWENYEQLWSSNKSFKNVISDELFKCDVNTGGYFNLVDYDADKNITSELQSILNSTENITISELTMAIDLTASYWRLTSLDVYLISEIISKVTDVDDNDILIALSDIMSNIMTANRDVLHSSHRDYNATERLKDLFEDITVRHSGDILIKKNNLVLVILSLDNNDVSAVTLKFYSGQYDVDLSDEIVTTEEVDSGIKISEELITQIKSVLDNTSETPRIILTIYFRDTFFQNDLNERTTSRIYSINFPGFNETFNNSVSVYFNISDITNYTSCTSWSSVPMAYSWKYKCQNGFINNFLECSADGPSQITSVEKHNITDIMIKILESDEKDKNLTCRIQSITNLYNDFSADDVHILVKILNGLTFFSSADLKAFTAIINNILQIPRDVLRESQFKYFASDKLLQRIVEILNVTAEPFPTLYKNDFFAFNVWNPKENTNLQQFGFIIYKNSTVTFIWKGQEKNIDFEKLDSVLLLSDELLTQLRSKDSCKVIVTIYFNDALFTERTEDRRNTSKIFGVTLPDFHDKFDGKISLLQKNVKYNKNFECAFWNYDTAFENYHLQGFWNVDENLKETSQNFTKCDYWQPHNYAYVENKDSNITLILKAILETPEGWPAGKLSDLNSVLTFYQDFLPIDVDLTARILAQIQNPLKHNLETLVNIVNAVMRIPKTTLLISQKMYKSTDRILQNVDRILTSANIGDSQIVDKENEYFALIVTTLNVTSNFRGISILSYENKFVVFYLNHEFPCQNLTTMLPNFQVGVVLSPDLLNQLTEKSSRLILTLYYSDVLFVEETPDDYVDSIVIGALLPDLNETMNGKLSLIYPHNELDNTFYNQSICSYWQYGETNTSLKSVWKEDLVPVDYGDYISCEYQHLTHFALVRTVKNITTDLEGILNSDKTGQEKLDLVNDIVSTKYLHLIPVDIYLISKILIESITALKTVNVSVTSEIISNLFNVPRYVLHMSQVNFNATDMILYSIDEVGRRTNETQAKYANFAFMVTDLVNNNITGVILNNCNSTLCNITYIYDHINVSDYSLDQYFGAAAIFSEELLDQIKEINAGKVVISVYYSDVLFNEYNKTRNTTRIFGIDLPDFNETFNGKISVVHNTGKRPANDDNCAYWNFKVDLSNNSNISPGEWVKDSSSELENLLSICEFSHITNFALLLADDQSDIANWFSLDLITSINCCLSAFGVMGILLTATLFEKWRKNTGNQILINFAIAITITMGMLYVSTLIYHSNASNLACTVTGAILHYSILSEFCWMLIIAILQFKRFVEVLGGRPKYVLLKALVCGWIFPIFPVVCVLIIDPDNYQSNTAGLCYPSNLGLYLGIWLPIVIIVTINMVIFIFIVYNVFHKKTQCPETVNHEILFQWRLALLLFFMLGLTWIFGFLGQIDGGDVFTYVFCFSATLQGFIMFLFFIVFNKSTRFLYSQWIKYWLYSKGFLMKK